MKMQAAGQGIIVMVGTRSSLFVASIFQVEKRVRLAAEREDGKEMLSLRRERKV